VLRYFIVPVDFTAVAFLIFALVCVIIATPVRVEMVKALARFLRHHGDKSNSPPVGPPPSPECSDDPRPNLSGGQAPQSMKDLPDSYRQSASAQDRECAGLGPEHPNEPQMSLCRQRRPINCPPPGTGCGYLAATSMGALFPCGLTLGAASRKRRDVIGARITLGTRSVTAAALTAADPDVRGL
jgi:hypothetical protein